MPSFIPFLLALLASPFKWVSFLFFLFLCQHILGMRVKQRRPPLGKPSELVR